MERYEIRDDDRRPDEADPTPHEVEHEGSFATGQEDRPHHPEDAPDGRFSRGQDVESEAVGSRDVGRRPADRDEPDADRRPAER